MAYNELNTLIDTFINRNGVQAITGQILNGVLKAMVQQLGAGYSIGGVAVPSDDPGTPDAPVAYFASEPGTYTDFGGITIAPGEFALLCYDLNDGWIKSVMYEGFQTVGATVDGNTGVPAVNVTYNNGVLSFAFTNLKGAPGADGAAAGFGTIGATVDANVGTPAVTVQESGPNTAKNLQFNFSNLKGETGVTSVVVTVDNTSGSPQCVASLNGQELTLAFTGLKGAQGNPGSSVDYPFTLVNNCTTNDPDRALAAAQGVYLDGKISQLEHEVRDFKGACYGVFETADDLPEDAVKMGYAYVGASSPYSIYNFDGNEWSDSGVTSFEAVITAEDLGEEVEAINLGPNVQYVEQNLTTAQKSQARTNIGAGTSDFTGNYNDLSNKPTIPELSTNVETDKTSDTKSSTPKSVYDFVIATINAKLADYYTKAQIDEIVLALKFPDEYQRVEYLQTDGTAYIDLGVNNKTTFGVRAKASNITGSNGCSCGAATGNLSGIGMRIRSSDVYYCAQRQANNASYASGSAENKYVQANFNASGKGYVEGMETTTTVTLDSYASANTSYTFLVFAVHNYQGNIAIQSASGNRLHHLQISDGENLVFDLYPCYRKLDSVPGLYDMVSGTFFDNAAGSGAFSVGNDI